jgi:predicted PurR-regulated permease PerM
MDINQISNRTIFRVLLIISSFIGLVALVWVLRQPLTWVIISFFLAVAIEPAVRNLSRFMPRHSRGLAAATVFLAVIGILSLLMYALVPPLVSQTQSFLNDLPRIVERMRDSDNSMINAIANSDALSNISSDNQGAILQKVSGLGNSLVDVIRNFFGSVVAVLTVITLTFFMVLEGPRWTDIFWRFQPSNKKSERRRIALQMARVVTGYTNGRLIISSIAALVSITAMLLVGVPYPIPLGIIVGLFGLLPLIGATLGAVIVVLVALTTNVSSGVIMAVFFIIYQQFENNIIQPIVDSKTVQISPLTALISALLGINLAGILGALLAIPVGACIQILVREYAHKRPAK